MIEITFNEARDLSKKSQEIVAQQIINRLQQPAIDTDTTMTPLEQFATLRAIGNAIEMALVEIAQKARDYVVDNFDTFPYAQEGKQFLADDLIFRMMVKNEYNWEANDILTPCVDKDGKTFNRHEWLTAQRTEEAYKQSAKSAHKDVTYWQTKILEAHPRLQPIKTTQTLMFIGTLEDKS